jgi:predicted Rossmann-fold nucleotide-binding protein
MLGTRLPKDASWIYWNEIINFESLVRHEMISAADLDLCTFIDEPAAAPPRSRFRLCR